MSAWVVALRIDQSRVLLSGMALASFVGVLLHGDRIIPATLLMWAAVHLVRQAMARAGA